jgi:hypothetical protein
MRLSSHNRSRTANIIPAITKTAPSITSSHHPQLSTDSGFASASPQSIDTARFNGRFRSIGGLSDVDSRASTASSTDSSGSAPANWDEPEPTQPLNRTRTDVMSRVSDPFDLDRPEFLRYTSETRYSNLTASRPASSRSVSRGSKGSADKEKEKEKEKEKDKDKTRS